MVSLGHAGSTSGRQARRPGRGRLWWGAAGSKRGLVWRRNSVSAKLWVKRSINAPYGVSLRHSGLRAGRNKSTMCIRTFPSPSSFIACGHTEVYGQAHARRLQRVRRVGAVAPAGEMEGIYGRWGSRLNARGERVNHTLLTANICECSLVCAMRDRIPILLDRDALCLDEQSN